MVCDPVFIIEDVLPKFLLGCFSMKNKSDSRIDHGLSPDDIRKILRRNINISKNLIIWQPMDRRSGLFTLHILDLKAIWSNIFTFLKMQLIFFGISQNSNIHIGGSILCRARSKAIEAKGILIVRPSPIIEFSPCIQLAENQLPVESLLLFIEFNRNATAMIFYTNRVI